jgi:hypothetical protein
VFDVQPSLSGEFVGDPSTIVNVLGLRAFGSVMDRVEGEVGTRKYLELKLEVCLPFGSELRIASDPMSKGKVEDFRVPDATVQKHVARFEVGLLFDGDALVAPVLNDQVMILPWPPAVPIHGDRGLHGAVREPAVSKSDPLRFATAGVFPEGKKVLSLVPRVGTEIDMPAQAEPADLG